MDKLERYLEAFRYAADLYRKYNGDYSKLTGSEIARMKIHAARAFKKASYSKSLFRISVRGKNELEKIYDSSMQNSQAEAKIKVLERQKKELQHALSQVQGEMSRARNELISSVLKHRNLEREKENLKKKIEENRQYLAGLVSDILDEDKVNIASGQENSSHNSSSGSSDSGTATTESGASGSDTSGSGSSGTTTYIQYRGNLASLHSNGHGDLSASAHGVDRKAPTTVGIDLNPKANGSVLTGDFKVSTMTNSDSSGVFNYMSWGTWDQTTPAQTRAMDNGEVAMLSGGHWVRGLATRDIPKQGSATYSGSLAGDYRSGDMSIPVTDIVIEKGTMSGTVTLNANFVTEKISGTLNVLHNNAPWIDASFTNGDLHRDYGYFNVGGGPNSNPKTPMTGHNVNFGYVNGYFYGEAEAMPQEAGGVWMINHKDNSSGAGIFRAKKK